MNQPLLDVRDLRVHFPVFRGFVQRILGGGDVKVHAVDGVTFSIAEGEVFGLVGESGCGKSTIAKTLVGLVRATSGEILFRGEDITRPDPKTLFRVRERIQLIYQDAHAALSPAMSIGEAIADVLRTHGLPTETGERIAPRSEQALREAVAAILYDVGLRPPAYYYDKYPDELSGGQKQRAMVATVMATEAPLMFLDEPTIGLDPFARRAVWDVLRELTRKGSTVLLTTHYLDEAEALSERLYIVEEGRVLFEGTAENAKRQIGGTLRVSIEDGGHQRNLFESFGQLVEEGNALYVITGPERIHEIMDLALRNRLSATVGPVTLEEAFLTIVGRSIDAE